MPVFKRRTRIVSFRLSEDEYEDLKGVCIFHGARSISEFARDAAQRYAISEPGHGSDLQAVIRELAAKVRQLDSDVKRLTHLVWRD